jgi:hypothetical protein
MASAANARRLNEAIEELRDGGGEMHDLIDPDGSWGRGIGSVKVQFASRGWEDYLTWQQDRQMLRRVNALIDRR